MLKCQVRNALVSIPFGRLEFSYCNIGLHSMHFRNVDFSSLRKQLDDGINYYDENHRSVELIDVDCSMDGNDSIGLRCVEYLSNYFNNKSRSSQLKLPPICWQGIKTTDFNEQVLKTLYNQVNYGQYVSYGILADLCGNSNASRAVGTAMRKNPICLVIPCHRVLRSSSNGSKQKQHKKPCYISSDILLNDLLIGNYNGGVDIKKWLLMFESNNHI